jgi:hypothetical protein
MPKILALGEMNPGMLSGYGAEIYLLL